MELTAPTLTTSQTILVVFLFFIAAQAVIGRKRIVDAWCLFKHRREMAKLRRYFDVKHPEGDQTLTTGGSQRFKDLDSAGLAFAAAQAAGIDLEGQPKCETPPAGWDCSRASGHPGPCAASPSKSSSASEGDAS